MRRILLIFILVIALAAMIIPAQAAGKTTIFTFWTFQELHKSFWDDATAVWNKAHPDKKIILKTNVLSFSEMHNKLLVALQSGVGAPDLVDIEISKYPNFLKGKTPQIIPLNSIVNPVLKYLVKARMDNYAKAGKYYGIDYHVGASVMYYNKDYMDKAGVNVDKILTWDDYVAAGKKVVAATGKPMATLEITDHWSLYPLISQIGSDYLDGNGRPILDNAKNIKVLTFLKDLIAKDKIAIPCPGGTHHTEEYWAFMNKGGAASVWMPFWYMGRFTSYMPDLKGKILVRPLPAWQKGGKRSSGMGGTGTSITAQCKNQKLMLQFMAAAKLSREGNIKCWTLLGFDPIRWDVYNNPAMQADNQYTAYFGKDIFKVLAQIKNDINPLHISDKFPQACDLIRQNVCFKVFKEQSQTPAQALKGAADELRKTK
jgi:arabinosaccharide transport system substrate-binding protein